MAHRTRTLWLGSSPAGRWIRSGNWDRQLVRPRVRSRTRRLFFHRLLSFYRAQLQPVHFATGAERDDYPEYRQCHEYHLQQNDREQFRTVGDDDPAKDRYDHQAGFACLPAGKNAGLEHQQWGVESDRARNKIEPGCDKAAASGHQESESSG